MENDKPKGPSTLLQWHAKDAAPCEIMTVTGEPLEAPNTRGFPGHAALHAAPSGRALLAVVETLRYSLLWIDRERRTTRCIGYAGWLAEFTSEAHVAFCGSRERFALEVRASAPGKFSQGYVVVYDAEEGWLGEATGARIAGWDGTRLRLRRGELTADRYAFREFAWEPTMDSAALAMARMTGSTPGVPSPEAARRVAIVLSERELRRAEASTGADAIAHASKAFDLNPGWPAVFDAYYESLDGDGQQPRRIRACQEHAAAYPQSRAAPLRLSVRLQKDGRLEEALSAARRACEIAPFWYSAHWQRGCVLAALRRLEEAEGALHEAARCDPQCVAKIAVDGDFEPLWDRPGFREFDYARHLARAKTATDPAAKESAYRCAIAIIPTRVEAHEGLLRMTEGTERCLAVAEAWCTADTASARARLTRCALLVDLNRRPEAEEEAAAILARWPDAYGAWLQRARIAIRRGATAEARAHLTHGRESFAQGDYHPWDTFAEEAAKFDELEELIGIDETERELASLDAYCAAGDTNVETWLRRCELLVNLARLPEAERAAVAVLERWPAAFGAHVQLARIAMRQEDRDQALRHVSEGRESFDRCDPAPLGTYDDAINEFEELQARG